MRWQGGYSLLLSVFMLLVVGGLGVGGTALYAPRLSTNETMELGRAREALMHYAINYIDHYGPQGAGLGHFPCPDTDKPTGKDRSQWHLDGPNPPCGRDAVQTGWLPRHVSGASGRYHFHTRNKQRLLYAVSGNFINNPLGRPVNPSTRGNIKVGQYNDVIAVLMAPPLETNADSIPAWFESNQFDRSDAAYTLIRKRDIQDQLAQRAGAWLISQLQQALATRCSRFSNLSACLNESNMHTDCDFSKQHQFMHWLYTELTTDKCETYIKKLESELSLLNGVPFKRHWFVRNGWHRFLTVTINKACIVADTNDCIFQLAKSLKGELLVILQPPRAHGQES